MAELKIKINMNNVKEMIIESITKHTKLDKLFITEIINDLHRYGFVIGGKAETMLHDWSRELKEGSRKVMPASRLKKTFKKEVGIENW